MTDWVSLCFVLNSDGLCPFVINFTGSVLCHCLTRFGGHCISSIFIVILHCSVHFECSLWRHPVVMSLSRLYYQYTFFAHLTALCARYATGVLSRSIQTRFGVMIEQRSSLVRATLCPLRYGDCRGPDLRRAGR